jgi:hypothetical protein
MYIIDKTIFVVVEVSIGSKSLGPALARQAPLAE